MTYSGQAAASCPPRQSVIQRRVHPLAGVALPLVCRAARQACRMNGVGWVWRASKASQAAASTCAGWSQTRMT